MSVKNLVTQDELRTTIDSLNALADNLNEHVNQSLSLAHGWNIVDSTYLDTGGNYHTDFGSASTLVPIPGLFNTGVNNDGTLATIGTADQHWTLVQSADSRYPGPNTYINLSPPSSYTANGPNSQWINPANNSADSGGGGGVSGGTYIYRLTFNLTGLNAASAVIKGTWLSDNDTNSILLNGLVTGFQGGGSYGSPIGTFQFLLTGPFLPGVNTLDFVVGNDGGPCSLRVEISGKASVGGAFAVPGLFNTGVKSDGTLAAPGTIDQHWTLVQSASPGNPGPNAYVITSPSSIWAKNTPLSQWIGPAANAGTVSSPLGLYVYRLTFDLTGYIPAATIVKGTFYTDDTPNKILLNGQATGVADTSTDDSNSWQHGMAFVITTGFQVGINTLDFYVTNSNNVSGLQVVIKGTSPKAGSNLTSRVLRLTVGGNVLYIPCQQSGGMDGVADPAIPVFTGIVSPQSADPATDLTVGSPTPAELVTAFASVLNAISGASSNTLLQHAGSAAESVHSGISWQPDQVFTTGGYLAGRRSVNILINGVQYKIVADNNISGPLNA